MDVLGHDRREGLGRRAHSRVALLTLLFVSILLLLSSLYSAEASVFRKARETVLDVAEWPLEVLSKPISYVQDVVGNVRDYFRVLEQNEALREENAELRQWMYDAFAMRETIAAYEKLESYYAPPKATPINAFVIGESNDAFVHSMVANAGAGDGVRRGQAVVDDHGLVGRVVEAGSSASRILLLTDTQSRVPVFIEGSEIEGILEGRSTERPAITFTESSEPVVFETGQRVLTSGAGGVIPRGLPVGVVRSQRDEEAVIDLYANYVRTRMVRIVNYEFPAVDPAEAVPETTGEPGETGALGGETAASAPADAPAETPVPAEEDVAAAAQPDLNEGD